MAKADFERIVTQVLEGGEMMEAFDEKLTPEQARLIVREIVVRFPERAQGD